MTLGIILFSLFISYLNIFGYVIGGIWLAFLGEWILIFLGIISPLICLLFFSIAASFIGKIILPFIRYCYERNNFLGKIFDFMFIFYLNTLIILICICSVYICSNFYINNKIVCGNMINYLPYLLWSWGMGLSPWSYWTLRQTHYDLFKTIICSASFFYFLYLISIFISPFLVLIIIVTFVIVQLIILPFLILKTKKIEYNLF